ncbi:trypsin-like serine peptidase [Streptomyces sp. NPDC054796]
MRHTGHHRRAAAGALVAVGALLGLVVQTVPAGAETGGAGPVGSGSTAREDTARFWTPERMREAEPLDLLGPGGGSGSGTGTGSPERAVPRGPELKVPGERAERRAAGPLAFPEGGGPWTGGGAVEQTSGRVFFTYQGRTASCSGNAVTSENDSTVITAGHCVKLDGAWHTDWVFVPGYHDGQAPYGKWTAAETLTTPQWEASEDINYDVGAAVVAPLDGQRLTDVVGAQGLAFNTGYNKDMYAFGFPAAAPYDGEQLIYCSGTAFRDFLLSDDHGLGCDMTGGSSGGPWFTEFDETAGTGLQSSVNSFGYTFLPGTMFGPYFGADAQNLYETAQTTQPG